MLNSGMLSSDSDKWNTPEDLYSALDSEFHFELDPCPEGFQFDGLSYDWNTVTYINPPYGRDIGKWVEKAYRHSLEGYTQVMLLPARTDTKWWHDYVMKAYEVRLIRDRLKFSGSKNSAPFPSAIVVFLGASRRCARTLKSRPHQSVKSADYDLPRFLSVDTKGNKIILE